MPRKLPDLSTTQLIASAVATAVAAFGASYLGVYGTIIGAALMSVISTAGSAVGKHYLDQGREQIKELTHLQSAVRRRTAAAGAADEATSADPTRTAVWSGDPNATRLDLPVTGDPNATRFDPGGDPNATRLDAGGAHPDPNATRLDLGAAGLDPAHAVAGSLAAEAGEDAVREVARRTAWQSTVAWAKAHWVKLAVSSAAVFVAVIGVITVVEASTGKPIGRSDKGLTVTNVLRGGEDGGQPDGTPSEVPSVQPTEPGTEAPSGEPTGDAPTTGPSTPGPEPTDGPTEERPTEEPTTTGPETPAPTAPDTPAPTEGRPDGGGGAEVPQTPAE
ncbi:hypothetical protein SAMN05443665_100727 [Actinomadura meyerae]|uniref:Uncharacterized protein n=1 Tax=Actinomadura meyerae TaxID=240840 RepID=A0A239G5P9_9ACTN|nr:hypothetical protein [Actinomadura meyerae]SNS64315.1 hypothetical protein SAMN05443665_100727 [Actinomadura meyerae]